MDLAPDTILLAASHAESGYSGTRIRKVTAAFARQTGAGLGVFYSGPVAMEDDPEAIFYDPGTFKALLKDILNRYSQVEILEPAGGEVARARLPGGLYALTETDIVKIA